MINSKEVQMNVLKDLIEKMRELEGSKLKPKSVEVSMSSMKPEDESNEPGEGTTEEELKDKLEGETPGEMQGKTDHIIHEHDQSDGGDELSSEDAHIIEELLGEDEKEV